MRKVNVCLVPVPCSVPLLVKLSPAPIRKITGTLSQRDLVLQTLELPH